MKKFYTINFPDKGEDSRMISEMREALLGASVPMVDIKSKYILIDAGDGCDNKPRIIYKNIELDISDAYVWFRRNGNSRRMLSVIATLLDRLRVPFSDPIKQYDRMPQTKPMQAVRLAAAGVHIPRTLVMTPKSFVANEQYIKSTINFPVVLKADGSQGRSVWRVNNIDEVAEKIQSEDSKRVEVFILQELVIGAESDIRVLFFKDVFLGAIRRSGEGFLNNYAQGGAIEDYILTDTDMVVCKAAKAVSLLDYVGVDIMHNKNGEPIVIELQHGPGSVAMRKVHPELNIGKSIIESLT